MYRRPRSPKHTHNTSRRLPTHPPTHLLVPVLALRLTSAGQGGRHIAPLPLLLCTGVGLDELLEPRILLRCPPPPALGPSHSAWPGLCPVRVVHWWGFAWFSDWLSPSIPRKNDAWDASTALPIFRRSSCARQAKPGGRPSVVIGQRPISRVRARSSIVRPAKSIGSKSNAFRSISIREWATYDLGLTESSSVRPVADAAPHHHVCWIVGSFRSSV